MVVSRCVLACLSILVLKIIVELVVFLFMGHWFTVVGSDLVFSML